MIERLEKLERDARRLSENSSKPRPMDTTEQSAYSEVSLHQVQGFRPPPRVTWASEAVWRPGSAALCRSRLTLSGFGHLGRALFWIRGRSHGPILAEPAAHAGLAQRELSGHRADRPARRSDHPGSRLNSGESTVPAGRQGGLPSAKTSLQISCPSDGAMPGVRRPRAIGSSYRLAVRGGLEGIPARLFGNAVHRRYNDLARHRWGLSRI